MGDGKRCGNSGRKLYRCPFISCRGLQSSTSYLERLRVLSDCVGLRVRRVGTRCAPWRMSVSVEMS